VVYHDMYWLPKMGAHHVAEALRSQWGRLFTNWENVRPDENGYPDLGSTPGEITTTGIRHFLRGMRLVGMAVKESPEFANSLRAGMHKR